MNEEQIKTLLYILGIVAKVLYAYSIYTRCKDIKKSTRNVLCFLSIPFPIITGIICLAKTKGTKNTAKSIVAFILSIIVLLAGAGIYSATIMQDNMRYDTKGNTYAYSTDVICYDKYGKEYGYNFAETGYDYLYSENEMLNADLCYLDENGILYYDDDMSIVCKDETCCIDTDGTIYYPVKFSEITEDGKIEYYQTKANFSYDKFGNAYVYSNIPYYDSDGNKLYYSLDVQTQEGIYTDINSKKIFDNEYSFVDEKGCFVYDEGHNFEQVKDITNVKTYKDSNGKIYYSASSISWNEKGELLDSFGKVINE